MSLPSARADEATSNSPVVSNPLRRADNKGQAAASKRATSSQASSASQGLQWRTHRQPESSASGVAPATLVEPVGKTATHRLVADQQPEEKSLLPPETFPLPELKNPAPGPAAAPPAESEFPDSTPPAANPPETTPAPAKQPYIAPSPGAEAPNQLPPNSLPLGEDGARKLEQKIVYDCHAAREALKRKKLSDIDLDIEVRARPKFEVPKDCGLGDDVFTPRDWECTNVVWTASGVCHKPLYFEEVQLERYGHSTGPYTQPLVSAGNFAVNVVLLPYHMGLKLPDECEYPLGTYEVGDCAPYTIPAFPITARAVLFELGAAAGLVYLLP